MASERAGRNAGGEGRFEGYLERIDNGWVFGWAWNERLPNAPIEVEVLVDGTPAVRALANLYRSDLESGGKGDGRHGFEARLPEGVKTFSRTIEVRFAGTEQELTGSPRVVAFDASADAATGPAYRSRFGGLWTDLSNAREVLDGKAALGWVTAEEKELLAHWIEQGFVLLP